ncbi:MAG: alpha-L-fucosidase [Terracidiphilus sp.]|nr:alpha-L-fucosidase [Terracidiphilus sp.]MDR3797191.1 alpha-L-fucosidase [Terracidiphilus sp.]
MKLHHDALNRREVLKGMGASALFAAASRGAHGAEYRRADASWLAACSFGVSTHWTAQSQTVDADAWLPFEETVARFSPTDYVEQIAGAGARYVIFTAAHALQMLPAPCEAIDRIAPRRTTKRDLIGEIADACRARGLHLIVYYNHSCNHGDDPEWEYAVGYHAQDKSRLTSNLMGIIRELGARYGSRVAGWWFDSCGSLDPRGAFDATTTDMRNFQFPWDEWVETARTGFDGRLVTLNSGVLSHYLYSTHQDYEAGEAGNLIAVPSAQFTTDHLQDHRWVCIDNPGWVHGKVRTPLAAPRFRLAAVLDYVSACNKVKVPVTFNVDIDRTGKLSAESLAQLHEVKKNLA